MAAAGNHFWSDLRLGYRVVFAENLKERDRKKPHHLKEMMGLCILRSRVKVELIQSLIPTESLQRHPCHLVSARFQVHLSFHHSQHVIANQPFIA